MDFRLIVVGTRPLLLDRLDDDACWQVFISCYPVKAFRYDEYAHFDTIELAQAFIEAFSCGEAHLFMKRAMEGQQLGKRSQMYERKTALHQE